MTFHRLFFAATLGLGGTALLVASVLAAFAATGTEDTDLASFAVVLAVPGLILLVAGYRLMHRELARGETERADRSA